MSGGNLDLYNMSRIFSPDYLQLGTEEEEDSEPMVKLVKKCSFPDFGAHLLQPAALTNICKELRTQIHQALSTISHVPSVILAKRMGSVWRYEIPDELYSDVNLERALKAAQKEEETEDGAYVGDSEGTSRSVSSSSKSETPRMKVSEEKRTGNALLMELGIKTGLSVIFSLLRHSWSQMAWQKQLEQALSQSNSLSIAPAPAISIPNEALKSVLDVLMGIPPMSLSNHKTMSQLSKECLDQSVEFLQWVVSPTSMVDAEGKRLAMQIMISLYLQRGSLVQLLEWAESVILLLASYHKQQGVGEAAPPSLEVGFCQGVLDEVRTRTVSQQDSSMGLGRN